MFLTAFLAILWSTGTSQATEPQRPLVFRWTSVAGFLLDDGETTLAFDPIFTRPGILNWMGIKPLTPDPGAIDQNLSALGIRKIDAVFVSHEHFDHAIDAPEIAHRFGAKIYGGESVRRISHANTVRSGWSTDPFQRVEDRETVTVGKFKIKFFRRDHAVIFPLFNFRFLPGEVPVDFNFGTYQYREGEVWCWKIEHPAGNVFADQGSHFFKGVAGELANVPYFLIGVANKVSVDDFVASAVGAFHPKIFIPLHFDFFFADSNPKKTWFLPGIEFEKIMEKAMKLSPKTEVRLPEFGERIELK